MGQKINPISNRIGIIRGWDSNWYGGDDYAAKLLEDSKIREYLYARISKVNLSLSILPVPVPSSEREARKSTS